MLAKNEAKALIPVPAPQRQDSLEDQMDLMVELAVRAGCYGAADWMKHVHVSRKGGLRPAVSTEHRV